MRRHSEHPFERQIGWYGGHQSKKSYLKKKSCENAREWKLRIWDPKQKTNFARELDTSPPSLSPPRARFDWVPRAYERCWKARRCTHEARTTSPWTHRREKIRDFALCAQLTFCTQLTANDALKHKTLLGGRRQKTHTQTRKYDTHTHTFKTTRARTRTSTRIRTHENALSIREIVI